MTNFKKIVRLGTMQTSRGRSMSVFCTIKFIDGKLSISGVEGPLPSGNCLGSCGQIDMHLKPEHIVNFAPGWDKVRMAEFLKVWDRWHLNDMKAGTPAQMEILRECKDEYEEAKKKEGGYVDHYNWACATLARFNMLYDNNHDGYKYGSAWLKEEVPSYVVDFLLSLPDSDKVLPHAWARD